VRTAITALRYAGAESSTPFGLTAADSTSPDAFTTVTPGMAPMSATAARIVASRSPRLLPSARTAGSSSCLRTSRITRDPGRRSLKHPRTER
jgi:hypothetical protein